MDFWFGYTYFPVFIHKIISETLSRLHHSGYDLYTHAEIRIDLDFSVLFSFSFSFFLFRFRVNHFMNYRALHLLFFSVLSTAITKIRLKSTVLFVCLFSNQIVHHLRESYERRNNRPKVKKNFFFSLSHTIPFDR